MEKARNVSAEQAIAMVMNMLDGIEVKGHANVVALANAMNLLAKVKEFIHKEAEPQVEIEPVEAKEESDG